VNQFDSTDVSYLIHYKLGGSYAREGWGHGYNLPTVTV